MRRGRYYCMQIKDNPWFRPRLSWYSRCPLTICRVKWKESLFYWMTPLEHIDFFYWMVIVTYFLAGNLLSPYRWLFPISSEGSFICIFPQTAQHIPQPFDGPVVGHWLEWKIARTAKTPAMQARLDDPNLYRRVLYRLSYVPPPR